MMKTAKNLSKRILSFLLCAFMLLGSAPLDGLKDISIGHIDFSKINAYIDSLTFGIKKAFAANADYTISLTWGNSPLDLDSHLEGTLPNGNDFHCYYSSKTVKYNSNIVASLNTDDTSAYGPEVITISEELYNRGTFKYYVYNYSGSGTMTSSSAEVVLKRGNTVIGTYDVPISSNSGRYWTVFKFNKGKVSLVNQISNAISTENGNVIVGNDLLSSYNTTANNGDLIITPKGRKIHGSFAFFDSAYETLDNISISCGSHSQQGLSDNQNIIIDYTPSADVIISCNEYRNYIIPKTVAQTWKNQGVQLPLIASNPIYCHTAYMNLDEKDNLPYISTVFCRDTVENKYKELQTEKLSVVEGNTYDIIISVGNKGTSCEYYLEQDYAHKIKDENNDGVFSSVDLFEKFEYGKTIYAYVKSNGRTSKLIALNIELPEISGAESVEAFFSQSTFNLFGSQLASVKIPKNIPLIGDGEISFDAFKLPIGYEICGNSFKASVGANIYNRESSWNNLNYNTEGTDYVKKSSAMFKDWKDLVNTTVTESMKGTMDGYKSAYNQYDSAKDLFCKKWNGEDGSKWMRTGKTNFDVNALGYIEMDFVKGKWQLKEAYISVEGSFSFKYTIQGSVWIIPAYSYVEAGCSIGFAGSCSKVIPDPNLPFDFELTLKIEPKLTLGAGVGVKDFLSLGLYSKATLPIEYKVANKHLTIKIEGEIGTEGEILFIKAKKKFISGTVNVVDKYYGSMKKLKQANPLTGEEEEYIVTYEIEDRDYLSKSSGWLGKRSSPKKAGTLSKGGMKLTTLQTSVFDNAQPQIVSFGNKMLMTWIEDDCNRDSYNRMRLMYSIYDGTIWTQPKPVYDDGTNDNAPSIATDGNNVYFVWQKVNRQLTADDCTISEEHDGIKGITSAMETYIAQYDGNSGEITNVKRLSENEAYDYSQKAVVIDGTPYAYWVTCNDSQIDMSTNNTIHRSTYNGDTETVKEHLNYILSLDASYVDNKNMIAYSMDVDGNTTTTNDINVFLYDGNNTSAFKNGDNDTVYTKAFWGKLEDADVLFVSDMSNIYYKQNNEIVTVFETNTPISGNINYLHDQNTNLLLWTEKSESGNYVCSSSFENGKWTTPIIVGDTGTYISNLSSTIYNNKISGVCNSSVISYNENTETYEESQVNLCSFIINEKQDISVDMLSINEKNIKKGETTSFDIHVANNGSQTINDITFLISDGLGYENTIEKNCTIPSGEDIIVSLPYTAPNHYEKTDLTVSVSSNDIVDENSNNNSVSIEIGVPVIVISESEVHKVDSNYYITAMVTNESDIVANSINISAMLNDEESSTYSNLLIENLEERATQIIEYKISENEMEFDEGVAKVFLSSENEDVKGNKTCVLLTQDNSVCAHSVTETKSITPNCISPGYEIITCCGCGETIKNERYPVLGHDIEDGTCTRCQVKMCDVHVHQNIIDNEFDLAQYELLRFIPYHSDTYTLASCSQSIDAEAYLYDNEMHILKSDVVTGTDNIDLCYFLNKDETYYFKVKVNNFSGEAYLGISNGSNINFPHRYIMQNHIDSNCFDDGFSEYVCERCGYIKKDILPALGHDIVDGKCTRCFEKMKDIYLDDVVFVSINEQNIGPLLRFVPQETGDYYFFSDSKDYTGAYLYDKQMNLYPNNRQSDECNFILNFHGVKDETYYLRVTKSDNGPGNLYVGLTDTFESCHNFKIESTIPPTCTEIGEEIYICTQCGRRMLMGIDATGHNFENGICTRCGLYQSEQFVFERNESDNTLALTGYIGENRVIDIPISINGIPVTAIRSSFWESCHFVDVLNIPLTIEHIDMSNSLGYSRISQINVAKENEYFSSEDGVLFNKDKSKLILFPIGTDIDGNPLYNEYHIPNSVTEIGACAFSAFSLTLNTLYIPKSIRKVEKSNFDIEWYDGLFKTHIIVETNTDSGIEIYDQLRSIGINCSSTYNSENDENLEKCGENVFWKIEEGVLVLYGSGPTYDYLTYTGSNFLNDFVGLSEDGDIIETKLPWYNFSDAIESVRIEEGVTALGKGLLNSLYCETVEIAESVSFIDSFCFEGSEIETLNLADSNCLFNDYSLFEATIGLLNFGTKTTFAEYAFIYSMVLTFSEDIVNSNYTVIDNGSSILNKEKTKFIYSSPFSSEICDDIVYEVPQTVVEIGPFAFFMSEFESIILPDSLKYIDDAAFGGACISEIELPDSLISIGTLAFMSSGISVITIPYNVENIGNGAFTYGCLSEINVDNRNTHYVSDDGVLFTKDYTELVCYPSEKETSDFIYTIPSCVNTIGSYSFCSNNSLECIYVPDSVTEIKEYAFFDSIALIFLSDSIQAIDSNVFSDDVLLVCNENTYAFNYAINNNIFIINEGVSFIGKPIKTYYCIGEELCIDGLNIVERNGTNLSNVTDLACIYGFDSSVTGKQAITIQYKDQIYTYEINVTGQCIDYFHNFEYESDTDYDYYELTFPESINDIDCYLVCTIKDSDSENRYSRQLSFLDTIDGKYILPACEHFGINLNHIYGYDNYSIGIPTIEGKYYDLRINTNSFTHHIYPGDKIRLEVFSDKYYLPNSDYTWFVSDESIAEVNNGIISFLSPGEVTIYVTDDKGRTGNISFHVKSLNTVNWISNGEIIMSNKLEDGERLNAPCVEAPEGYRFVGWSPAIPKTMPEYDLDIFAVFERTVFDVTFIAKGEIVSKQAFSIDSQNINEPEVPKIPYFLNGRWENYTLSNPCDIIVNAIYESPTTLSVAKHTMASEKDYRLLTSSNFRVTKKEWRSDNPDVAKVDSHGNVTAIGNGECFVKVTCYGVDDFGNEIMASSLTLIVVKDIDNSNQLTTKEKFKNRFINFLSDLIENIKRVFRYLAPFIAT